MGPGLRTAPGLRRRAPAVGQGLGPRPRPPPRAPGLGAPAPSLGPAPRAPGLWSLGPRPRGPGSRLLTPSRQEARPLPAGSCGCGAVVAVPRLRAQPGPRGPGPDDNQRICIPCYPPHTPWPAQTRCGLKPKPMQSCTERLSRICFIFIPRDCMIYLAEDTQVLLVFIFGRLETGVKDDLYFL